MADTVNKTRLGPFISLFPRLCFSPWAIGFIHFLLFSLLPRFSFLYPKLVSLFRVLSFCLFALPCPTSPALQLGKFPTFSPSSDLCVRLKSGAGKSSSQKPVKVSSKVILNIKPPFIWLHGFSITKYFFIVSKSYFNH